MKKLIFGLLFLCATGLSAQTYNYDVNGDGSKDIADLAFFINYLKSYSGSGTPAYDVNGDGLADITDVTCLQDYILGRVAEDAHEYVDLGLSVKWATCNIGADNPEDYGLYFAWGETTGYTASDGHNFAWANYAFGTENALTKYNTSDNLTALELTDDAAHANWGDDWRMATDDEFTELIENCTWTWTTQSSVKGFKVTSNVTGYTDKSIFLPATGRGEGTTIIGPGSYGYYWSSSLYTGSGEIKYGCCTDFHQTNKYGTFLGGTDDRFLGHCIRPVCP